jgi:hypothetical protein
MRRNDHMYPSGLVETTWIAECGTCQAAVSLTRVDLARAWEHSHAQHGCMRPLIPDESGRGWVALPPVPA